VSPVRTLEVYRNQHTKGLAMESIAVPVSLTIELRPEGADIGSLERAVSAGLAEAGRQLWAEVIGTLERALLVHAAHPARARAGAPPRHRYTDGWGHWPGPASPDLEGQGSTSRQGKSRVADL
jgi:hypothetical protein